MHKVLLYYRFTPIADPEAVRLWQYTLGESLGLTGRILISPHGINGTVGGELEACKQYVKGTRQYSPFRGLDVKWSMGTGEEFPKLSVKVRDEIVTFGAPEELAVSEAGVVGRGAHLSPDELHALLEQRPETVLFDGRNTFEADIGRFKNAIVPEVETTKDFAAVLDSGRYDHLKSTPVVTYCTGGVRCEVLSSLMRSRGFTQVYQLAGGIVRYGAQYGNDGLWEGSLYVFDRRGTLEFGANPKVVGTCAGCGTPANHVVNCADESCTRQLTSCRTCVIYCPDHLRLRSLGC